MIFVLHSRLCEKNGWWYSGKKVTNDVPVPMAKWSSIEYCVGTSEFTEIDLDWLLRPTTMETGSVKEWKRMIESLYIPTGLFLISNKTEKKPSREVVMNHSQTWIIFTCTIWKKKEPIVGGRFTSVANAIWIVDSLQWLSDENKDQYRVNTVK